MRKCFSYIPLLALIATIGCATTAGDKTKEAYIDQNAAKQIYTKGVEYAAQGKFKEAKEEFEKALKVDPFYEPAKESLRIIEDVADKKIESKTAIHLFKGQTGEVIAEYNKAIEINPRYAKAYSNRGAAYAQKGQFDRAFEDYNKAIEINPKYADAYVNRGNAYQNKGQYDKAISDYNKAIEINPKYADAYNNRGVAYYFKGEYNKAWEDVHKAQSLGYQVHPGFLKALREASEGVEETLKKDVYPRKECEKDCKKMYERGELKKGMSIKECISILCK